MQTICSRYATSSGFIKTNVWKSPLRNNEIKLEKHCSRYWVNFFAMHETVLHNWRTVLPQIPTLPLIPTLVELLLCIYFLFKSVIAIWDKRKQSILLPIISDQFLLPRSAKLSVPWEQMPSHIFLSYLPWENSMKCLYVGLSLSHSLHTHFIHFLLECKEWYLQSWY